MVADDDSAWRDAAWCGYIAGGLPSEEGDTLQSTSCYELREEELLLAPLRTTMSMHSSIPATVCTECSWKKVLGQQQLGVGVPTP